MSKRMSRRLRWILRVLAIGGLVVLAQFWYVGSHIDGEVYGPAELGDRQVVQIIRWNEDYTAVQVSCATRLPVEHLWRVVADQGRFQEYMPWVASSTVRPGPSGTLIDEQRLDLPMGTYALTLEITLERSGNTSTARWRQLEGELAFNEGAWVVEDHGDSAVLRYQVAASLRLLPQWALNYTMRLRLGRLLDAVLLRVRQLEQTEPEYFREATLPASG